MGIPAVSHDILEFCALLGNQIIEPGSELGQAAGQIECRERLGGLLRYYYCEAA